MFALYLVACVTHSSPDEGRFVDATVVLGDGQQFDYPRGASPLVARVLSDGACAPSVLLDLGMLHLRGEVYFSGEELAAGTLTAGSDDGSDLWFLPGFGGAYTATADSVTLTDVSDTLVAFELTGSLCYHRSQQDEKECVDDSVVVQLHATGDLAPLPAPTCASGTQGSGFGDLCEAASLEEVECPE